MTLETMLQLVVLPHVVAGTLALILFWLAAFVRKGSRLHRRAGQGYLLAMLVIIVTAIPLVALFWLRGQVISAMFLGYLVVLVSLTCRNAWCAVRLRRDPARFAGPDLQILALLAGLAGVGVMITGLRYQAWILVIFGLIGPIGLVQTVALVRAQRQGKKRAPNWWLREHYGAMIGNGVATHIAFFQIGLVRLFPGLDMALIQQLAWFGPLAIAGLAVVWLNRRHGRSPDRDSSSPNVA